MNILAIDTCPGLPCGIFLSQGEEYFESKARKKASNGK